MDRKMKDSYIEWIKEIPEDWKLKRIQFCLEEINEKNSPIKTEQVLSLVKDKGVMLYEEKGNQGNKAKEDVSQYKIAYPNTLIVNSMNILIGSVGISNYLGCVSPVYYIFKDTEESDLRYINYIFNTALISFLCYNFNKLNLTYIISISFIVNLIIWIIIGILKKRVYSII